MPDCDPSEIEILSQDGFVEARYLGSYTLESYKKRMQTSVESCLRLQSKLLLVDIRSLSGYRPTILERHQIGVYGSELSRGLTRVAALGTADQIEPDPLASLVARNRGLRVQAFIDREQAIDWLLHPQS